MKITLLKNSFLGVAQQSLLAKRIKEELITSPYTWTDNYSEADILLFCEFFPSEIPEVLPYSSFIRSSWGDLYQNPLEVLKNEKRLFLKEAKFFSSSKSKKDSLNILVLLEDLKDPIESFIISLSLEQEASKRGWSIKIYKNESFLNLSELINEIELLSFDFIISTLRNKDKSFLRGKKVHFTTNKNLLKSSSLEMDRMVNNFRVIDNFSFSRKPLGKKINELFKDSLFRNLLTGFYFALPMVTLGFSFMILSIGISFFYSDSIFSYFLNYIEIYIIPFLIIPFLSASIAFCISDRQAIFAGAIGGFLANELGTGFLGGILTGFLAGFIVYFLLKRLPLYGFIGFLNYFFIIPFFSSIVVCITFSFIIVPPFYYLTSFLSESMEFLKKLHPFILGSLLGAITASDLGGIMTKSSYVFGLSLLEIGAYVPLGAIIIGAMLPPIAMGIITWVDYFLKEKKYNSLDRQAGLISFILGIFLITEGAIPIAIKDLPKSILSCTLGGALGGGFFMILFSTLVENSLNLFRLDSFSYISSFLISLILGVSFTIILFYFFKRVFIK